MSGESMEHRAYGGNSELRIANFELKKAEGNEKRQQAAGRWQAADCSPATSAGQAGSGLN